MFKSARGFTLVELLVVVSIIAILSIIGLAFFGNVQRDVRDARRRADIDTISKALEVNYDESKGVYKSLANSQFTDNLVPADPSRAYCYQGNTTGADIVTPSPWISNACPSTAWSIAADGVPAATANHTTWKVCASLEKGTVFCKRNAQ